MPVKVRRNTLLSKIMAKIIAKFYVNFDGEFEGFSFSGLGLEISYLGTIEQTIKAQKPLLQKEQWYRAKLVKVENGVDTPWWDIYHYELVWIKCCTRFL